MRPPSSLRQNRKAQNKVRDYPKPLTQRGALLTKTMITMKEKFQKWMRKNNMMFSAIAGETFTNAEVVYTHIGLLALLIVLGLIGTCDVAMQ